MFCSNCGKEIKEGALFCSSCGAKVKVTSEEKHEDVITEEVFTDKTIQENLNSDTNTNPVNDESVEKTNDVKKKKNIFDYITAPKIYYPAMVVLVVIAAILGHLANDTVEDTIVEEPSNEIVEEIPEETEIVENDDVESTDIIESNDLGDLVDASEQEVASFFNMDVNEDGCYPVDSELYMVQCIDGKTNNMCLTADMDNYDSYCFYGLKIGDSADNTINVMEAEGYSCDDIQAYDDNTTREDYVNGDKYVWIFTDESGLIDTISYMLDAETETDDYSEDYYGIEAYEGYYQGDYIGIALRPYTIIEGNEVASIEETDLTTGDVGYDYYTASIVTYSTDCDGYYEYLLTYETEEYGPVYLGLYQVDGVYYMDYNTADVNLDYLTYASDFSD